MLSFTPFSLYTRVLTTVSGSSGNDNSQKLKSFMSTNEGTISDWRSSLIESTPAQR